MKQHVPTLGLMHNKFMVIDRTYVITGSANLTEKAIDPHAPSKRRNFENITVFTSNDVAQRYSNYFDQIKNNITALYIEQVAKIESGAFPAWWNQVVRLWYKNSKAFADAVVESYAGDLNQEERKRLEIFFDFGQKKARVEPFIPATKGQIDYAATLGISVEGMSKAEAIQYIEQALKRNCQRNARRREQHKQ